MLSFYGYMAGNSSVEAGFQTRLYGQYLVKEHHRMNFKML